ncbi:MAG: TonB-dependent receptor, partial [Bacteroidales bacterium]|nr:TonB-dependent receptor [Bacteroidales bacterium]
HHTLLDTTYGDSFVYAHETMLYVEDNIDLGRFIKANLGLHYSTFFVQQQFYHSLQPRLGLRFLFSEDLSFKAGYAMMSQYIHLLSNSSISLPTDLWVPVTKRITPMRSHQVSAGLFYNLNNLVDFSVEGYYKSMYNILEYKDGASFMGSTTGWEDKVSMGRGWSYGLEFLAQKSYGRYTGWIGYTWAKSERLFDRPGQELNNGKVFPAKYDRRHDLSITAAYKLNERIDFAATWIYSSGNCATLALQNYEGSQVPDSYQYYFPNLEYIESRNNYRFESYQRLDIGVNFRKKLKHGTRTWNISVYNAYNRNNPFFVYPSYSVQYNPVTQQYVSKRALKQVSIFPIIPSISYSYSF